MKFIWQYISVVDKHCQKRGYNDTYILRESKKWFDCIERCKYDARKHQSELDYPCC